MLKVFSKKSGAITIAPDFLKNIYGSIILTMQKPQRQFPR